MTKQTIAWRALLALAILASIGGIVSLAARTFNREVVGTKKTTSPGEPRQALVPTHQRIRPVGRAVEFTGRPIDLVLAPDGKHLYVKYNKGVMVVDTVANKNIQEIFMTGTSMHGIALSADGKHLYATDAASQLFEGDVAVDGTVAWRRQIALPQKKRGAYGCGIALSPDGKRAFVCLSRNNSLAVVDLEAGKVIDEIPTEIAPYDVVLMPGGKAAWVSDWGGRFPRAGDKTAPSAGTETIIDARGVASSGCVSRINLTKKKERQIVDTDLHPSDILLSRDSKRLYVANANSDTVTVIDTATRKVLETISVHADNRLPFGSAPTGLAFSPDEKTLYVTCGGNNAVAVIHCDPKGSQFTGLIPAGWYPGAIVTDATTGTLYIANVKGIGSRTDTGNEAIKGRNVLAYCGTVQTVDPLTGAQLDSYTKQAKKDALLPEALRQSERREQAGASGKAPVPVPERPGEPSVFEHVVYILKENRTYDQVFGDLTQGNGDARLCTFGRKITPNHHALAEQFVLLDNYYCNGAISADGHSWATEGNVTDHLEKAFGGMSRSYTFGDDPLTYSSTGFIWDNVLAHGQSFRNYGEMDYAGTVPVGVNFTAIYRDYVNGTKKITFRQQIGIDNLARYSQPDYPGWNTSIPDVIRADRFLKDLARCEKEGHFPNLVLIYLPNDHTGPDVSPESYLADNDLALGRVIEGISKSSFWPKTCIFVNEDDPQAGWDHIDGHRSLCLVVSPYTKRKAVIHDFYNQTGVLHTMEQILGLPPMNQMDAMAPLMQACFTKKPDLTPYAVLPNSVSIVDTSHSLDTLRRKYPQIAALSRRVRFDLPDAGSDDAMNRILWTATKGTSNPYPARFAGKDDDDDDKDRDRDGR